MYVHFYICPIARQTTVSYSSISFFHLFNHSYVRSFLHLSNSSTDNEWNVIAIFTSYSVRSCFEPRSNIPWLKKIIWVIGVLRTTVVCDSEDDCRTGCRNVSRKQQSFSGLQSPRWSFSIKVTSYCRVIDDFVLKFPYCSSVSACAAQASRNGFTVFGLQFFGECWSGANASQTYAKDGPSQLCLMAASEREFKKCNDASIEPCLGVDFKNYVYRITNPGTFILLP